MSKEVKINDVLVLRGYSDNPIIVQVKYTYSENEENDNFYKFLVEELFSKDLAMYFVSTSNDYDILPKEDYPQYYI